MMPTSDRSGEDSPIRFGLIGTFDVNNFGDCLFPELYVKLLGDRFPRAEFSLYSPTPLAADILSFGTVHALPQDPSVAPFDEDALILTGGETLVMGHGTGTYMGSLSQLSPLIRLWLAPVLASCAGQSLFAAHSVGLPPGNDDRLETMAAVLESADWVTLRDEFSSARLGSKFGVAVDPVFLLPAMLPDSEWSERARAILSDETMAAGYVVAQASFPYLRHNLGEFCDAAAAIARSQDCDLVLLPVCHFLNDHQTLSMARELLLAEHPDLAGRIWLPGPQPANVKDTAAVIAASRGYVGTSLHAAVTASAFGLPVAVLAGKSGLDGKHARTLRAAGFDHGVSANVAGLSDAFAKSRACGLKARADAARDRAMRDFDALCDFIASNAAERHPVDTIAVQRLRKMDRAGISGPADRMRHLVFSTLRRFPSLNARYRAWRVSRSVSAAR